MKSKALLLSFFFCFCVGYALRASPRIEIVDVAADGKQPRIAAGPKGEIGIVYGFDGAIYFRGSEGPKIQLGEPVKIAMVSPLALGMRRGPQIAYTQNSIIVSAMDRGAGNLLSWRSLDRGKTWEGPIQVNEVKGSASEGLHSIAAGRKDEAMHVWQDKNTAKEQRVLASRTLDGGKTWSKGILVYQSPSGSVCPCCHPSVTSNKEGTFYAMWRNLLKGDRDFYWAKFNESEIAFKPAEKLGIGSWRYDSCPMDGGGMIVQPDGKLLTVWRRERKVFTASPGSEEKLLATGFQPVVAEALGVNHYAWQGGDKIFYHNSVIKEPALLELGAFPSIAATPEACVVVFERIQGTTIGIRMALITAP